MIIRNINIDTLTYGDFLEIRWHHQCELLEKRRIVDEILDKDIFYLYQHFKTADELLMIRVNKKKFLKILNTVNYLYENPEVFRESFHITYEYANIETYHKSRFEYFGYSNEDLILVDEIVKKRRKEIELKNETIK